MKLFAVLIFNMDKSLRIRIQRAGSLYFHFLC